MRRPFAQSNVFSDVSDAGSPVAVVLDADGLDDGAMHAVARRATLSETTSVLTPTVAEADHPMHVSAADGELWIGGRTSTGIGGTIELGDGRVAP